MTRPNGLFEEKKQENNEILKEKLKEIISKVKLYESRLIDLHIENLREKIFDNYKYLKVIRKVVVCAHNTAEEICAVCNNVSLQERNYTDLLSIHDLNDISPKICIDKSCPEFTGELAASFKKILYSPWHSYKDGHPVNLTSDQARLSASKEGVHYNIVSCAGSGKTEVLVHRAVDANIHTGQPVLILTFNLALRNYIKYRLGLVAADFNWNDFVILNYHEFFNSQAINCGVPVHDLAAYRNLEYFKGHSTKRYASIFIDEAQDYESSWLTILYKHFLKRGGEMILFEDASQDLYHRRVNKETHHIKFEKRLLKKGASSECRFKNDAIFNLVQRFATHFQLGIDEPPTLGLFSDQGVIKNAYVEGRNCNAETYGAWVDNIIKEYGLLRDDCVVIASTHDLLQEIDLAYRHRTGAKTITTFPTDEQHNKMSSMSASAFVANERSLERTKKLNFSMINEGLKLSTIYSFKGWEADNVILFIQEPERGNEKYDDKHPKPIELAPARALCPEIIYTAISRARVNLFIINLGNEQYKQFFNENIP
jgi:superfamily I DNA/RNA helicase